jgi:hypothetical protein
MSRVAVCLHRRDHLDGGRSGRRRQCPVLAGAAILARTPGSTTSPTSLPVDLGRTPASHFTLPSLLEIGVRIRALAAERDVAGVVVVQGTDSMEETAFCWDLVHDLPEPVIVTGAMRSSSEAGYDGPANLVDAVRCAVEPALRDQGVLVAMAGGIHAADDVTKTHASALDTFQSLNDGPLGSVAEDGISVLRKRAGRRHVAAASAAEPIHLLTVTVGMDGSLLDAAVELGARGVVVAATGGGNSRRRSSPPASERWRGRPSRPHDPGRRGPGGHRVCVPRRGRDVGPGGRPARRIAQWAEGPRRPVARPRSRPRRGRSRRFPRRSAVGMTGRDRSAAERP